MITATNHTATVEKQVHPSFCIMRKIGMPLAASDFQVLQDVDDTVYHDVLQWQLWNIPGSFSTLSLGSTSVYCWHPIRPRKATKSDGLWNGHLSYRTFIGKISYFLKLRKTVDFFYQSETSCMHSQASDWLFGISLNCWPARLLNFYARRLRLEVNDSVNKPCVGNTINSIIHGRAHRAIHTPKMIGSRS